MLIFIISYFNRHLIYITIASSFFLIVLFNLALFFLAETKFFHWMKITSDSKIISRINEQPKLEPSRIRRLQPSRLALTIWDGEIGTLLCCFIITWGEIVMKILISATKMQGYVYFMSYRGDGNFMCHTKMQDDANVVLLGDGNFMCYLITSDENLLCN